MMEVFENSHKPFDLLPNELVIKTLSFVDADTLLDCRLVCKRWRELIYLNVFQDKASRENKFVNNGRGYYSFSQIDSNSVRRLDLPWFVFYVICKYDPFNRNLMKNHCGQNGMRHWNSHDNNLWSIEPTPEPPLPSDPCLNGHTSCFVSKYELCEKSQIIQFKNYGLNDTVMKILQPEISVSEWYNGNFASGCIYVLRASVLYKNNILMEQRNYNDILPRCRDNIWTKASFIIKNSRFASCLELYHSGVDTQVENGHHGTQITGSEVKVLLPIRFKSAAEHVQTSSTARQWDLERRDDCPSPSTKKRRLYKVTVYHM